MSQLAYLTFLSNAGHRLNRIASVVQISRRSGTDVKTGGRGDWGIPAAFSPAIAPAAGMTHARRIIHQLPRYHLGDLVRRGRRRGQGAVLRRGSARVGRSERWQLASALARD